jgi:hypothetical protein
MAELHTPSMEKTHRAQNGGAMLLLITEMDAQNINSKYEHGWMPLEPQ